MAEVAPPGVGTAHGHALLIRSGQGPEAALLEPPVASLDPEHLVAAAVAGGDYLRRMLLPSGRFVYLYDPLEDQGRRGYNMLRHAGTAWSLLQLYEATGLASYREAARRAIDYLRTRFRAVEGDAVYVLDHDGKAKLGGNGLALLALTAQIRLDPPRADPDSALRLARMILALQHPDGTYESYYRLRGDEPRGSVSLYYPGEAILGLTRLYAVAGQAWLLESAQRGAGAVIATQRAATRLPADAWLMQALEDLFALDPQPDYLAHALALAEAMIAEQYGEDAPAEYVGGFRPGLPRSTPASARSEGLLAAYRLARATGDERAAAILTSLERAARFVLGFQYHPDTSPELPAPQRAAGGIRGGFDSPLVRIDYVQHAISALLGLAEQLALEPVETG